MSACAPVHYLQHVKVSQMLDQSANSALGSVTMTQLAPLACTTPETYTPTCFHVAKYALISRVQRCRVLVQFNSQAAYAGR